VHAPEWAAEEMSAASDWPRWYIQVSFPVSDEDRRGIFEIPAAMFASTVISTSITVLVDPDDPEVGTALDLLSAAEKTGHEEPITFRFCGHTFCLDQGEMQIEFLVSLRAFLIGAKLGVPVETSAMDTLQ
jgi:hypothetical protein